MVCSQAEVILNSWATELLFLFDCEAQTGALFAASQTLVFYWYDIFFKLIDSVSRPDIYH